MSRTLELVAYETNDDRQYEVLRVLVVLYYR